MRKTSEKITQKEIKKLTSSQENEKSGWWSE